MTAFQETSVVLRMRCFFIAQIGDKNHSARQGKSAAHLGPPTR